MIHAVFARGTRLALEALRGTITEPLAPREALFTPLKLHLRCVTVHGRTLRVITLRASETARFSTNRYHDTWHVLTDPYGARFLGRLLWGLSYQREPGTLVLLHGEHLVTTPFEGDAPDPVLWIPSWMTRCDKDLLHAL